MPDQSDKIPVTGPEAIEYALAHLNTEEMEQEARAQIKSGKKSSRAAAVKRLNILSGLKRNQQTPSDFIIHKVPVLPTKYRPFAAQGDTLLPGDENVLYKDALDIINAYKDEAEVFGAKNAGKSRLAMYDAVKSLYGYGDAVKAKTRSKGIEGYLKKIVGKGSKFSMAQRRLFTKTQDNVGRSTIIVDPDLDMNHIGLPKDLAFPMYAPYIQRALKRKGFTDAEALRHTKDRSEEATRALKEVMKEKPVLYSRSPAWFEFNLQGAFPVLTEGAAISMPPAVMQGLAGDFDGNCIIGSSKILIRLRSCSDKSPTSLPITGDYDTNYIKIDIDKQKNNNYNNPVMHNARILAKTDSGVIAEMDIKDVPFLADTKRLDKNGASVYDVPAGIEVLAATPEKGVRWEKVDTFTREEGCVLKKVTTSRGFDVVCSANESLAAFNPEGGLQRIKPDDAIIYTEGKNGKAVVDFAHAVPITRRIPIANPLREHGFELGWLIGAFVSDGTLNDTGLTFTKLNDATRATFLKYMGIVSGTPGLEEFARTYSDLHDAAKNGGVGGMSVKLCITASKLPKMIVDLFSSCYDKELRAKYADTGERSCLAKRLPADFVTYGKDVLMGIVSGLLDGDGSLSIKKDKKKKGNDTWVGKPQVLCSISTSSAGLRDDIILMSKMLGLSMTYSTVKATKERTQTHDNYVLIVSTEWLWDNLRCIKLASENEAYEYLKKNKPDCSTINVTPMSYYALTKLEKAYPEVKKIPSNNAWCTIKSRTKKYGYELFSRDTTRRYAELIMHYVPDYKNDPALWSVVRAAFDDDITWTRYKSIEDAPTEPVYDLGVPGAKVFALSSGLIVYDTINVHVPASDAASKEVAEKLLPSHQPFMGRVEDTVIHTPKQEEILGLYTAATAPATKPIEFNSREDAMKAIRQGNVKLSDDITYPGMEDDVGYVK